MIDEAGLEKAAAVGDDLMAGSECVPLDVWREGIEAYQAHLASQASEELVERIARAIHKAEYDIDLDVDRNNPTAELALFMDVARAAITAYQAHLAGQAPEELVERLREHAATNHFVVYEAGVMREAADEIERLRAVLHQLTFDHVCQRPPFPEGCTRCQGEAALKAIKGEADG